MIERSRPGGEAGIALPIAILFTMVVTATAAIFAELASRNFELVKEAESTVDLFDVSEGVTHDLLRSMTVNPHLWREKVSVPETPAGYSEYSPGDFSSSNGIPSCLGLACERSLYPTGGGLIKNAGPIGGDGDHADATHAVTNQLNLSALQDPDITLNGHSGWVQVERLDETGPGASTIGGDLANNPQGGGGANVVRFRITGTALRSIKGRVGQSTVVVTAEVPNA